MDGRLELVAAATEGEIRGFMPSNPEARAKVFDLTSEQEAIRELTQKKANLILELKNYEENARLAPAGPGVLLAASKANATGTKILFTVLAPMIASFTNKKFYFECSACYIKTPKNLFLA